MSTVIDMETLPMDFASVREAYALGMKPADLVKYLYQKADQYVAKNIWIRRLSLEEIEPYLNNLEGSSPDELPLYGIPFAIKDNIDLAAVETTAACVDFGYEPKGSAFVVQKLIDAGAIPLGKTNMDQFATGLVGTRSPEPWGPCKNAFDDEYISGGSSSGSAVAVSLGLASFSLGTDTAGSGRVPAMLNNIVGLKPSKGLFSMSGVVPACRSLDCPSVFALRISDAQEVFSAASDFDSADAYSRRKPFSNTARTFGTPKKRPVIGCPKQEQLSFFGEDEPEALFYKSLERWKELGAEIREIDFLPLFEAAKLLYEGPWVAERYVALEDLMTKSPEKVHPVVRGIVQSAEGRTAVETFQFEYRMQEYRALAKSFFEEVDFLLTPTAPRHYLLEEVLENPVELNSNMGYYTNYMNLLDLCGLAVPAGFTSSGLPFGVTMIAPAFSDVALSSYGLIWEALLDLPLGATSLRSQKAEKTVASATVSECIAVAVCGAHLSDLPLNWQLSERGATLNGKLKTAKAYRMYVLEDIPPIRPGLIRDVSAGQKIDVEVWSIPSAELGSFVDNIPHPLGIGKIELEDGNWVSGFICESFAVEGCREITEYGSWREYLASV